MNNIAAIELRSLPLRWMALLLCLIFSITGRAEAADAAPDIPTVIITAPPKFIRDPNITIKGRASFSGGVKWTWYDWYDKDNRIKDRGWLTTPEATDVSLEKDILLDVDGEHWFRFYAEMQDGQEVWADWKGTVLDTTAPKIADRTQAGDGILETDTVLRIDVTDQDPGGKNDASGIAAVTMEVTDKNDKQYGPIELVRQEQGIVREKERIHAASYTAALANIFAQLPEGAVNIKVSTEDALGNDRSQILAYRKAGPPVASVTVPAQVTNQPQIALGIKVDGDREIRKIWLDTWMMKGDKKIDLPRADIAFPKSKTGNLEHPYAFQNGDGKYFFRIAAEDDDGRQTDMTAQEPVYVLHDATPAEVSEISPVEGSKIGYEIAVRFRADDKDGSGIDNVQMQLCSGDTNCAGWYSNVEMDDDGLYAQKIRSRDFWDGELTLKIWIKDNAGNITWKYVKYEKYVPSPMYSFLKIGETSRTRTINFMFHRTDGDSESMRFDIWKDGEDAVQSLVMDSVSGEKVWGAITVPDDGIYYWNATVVPQNIVVIPARRIAISTVGPILHVDDIKSGAINEGKFEMTARLKSAVDIADVQLQVCQADRCGNWIDELKSEDKLAFSSDISVDHLAGAFQVKVWAKDEAGLVTQENVTYFRQVPAEAALSVALEQGAAGEIDSPKGVSIAREEKIIYRITLTNDRHTIEGASLRYRLPDGLRSDGIARLVEGDAGAALNADWNGDADDELLGADTELKPAARMVIEVPVALKDAASDSSILKSTVYAGAKNLVGTVNAMHHFRLADRLLKGGHGVRIIKSVDGDAVAQPGAQIRYRIRVSNQTFKTVRNLLIRDRAPDHTTLNNASCGNLPSSACKTVTLSDKAVEDGSMTHTALCKAGGMQSDPQGQHVFWCLNGDLEPLADYVVVYSVRINDGAAATP